MLDVGCMPVSASRYARLLRRGLRPVVRLGIIHELSLQTPCVCEAGRMAVFSSTRRSRLTFKS